jgi:hypothetical protein
MNDSITVLPKILSLSRLNRLSSEPDMLLTAGDSHLHIALHGEEVSLHRERMCLVHHLKIELLDKLSDKLV